MVPTASQSFQRLGEDAARGGNVETHETLATLAEHLSVVEGKMSLLYKEINELLVVETKVATVEPYEEGGLWAPWLYLWNILAAVVNDIVDVPSMYYNISLRHSSPSGVKAARSSDTTIMPRSWQRRN